MDWTTRLLERLTEKIPDDQAHHNITSWGRTLYLNVIYNNEWHTFILEKKDEDITPEELADEIAAYLAENFLESAEIEEE